MQHDFKEPRTAIVTGASGGIGTQVCRTLLDTGWNLGITYRNNFPGKLIDAYPERIHSKSVDLLNIADCRTLLAETTSSFSRPTAVIHAAGPHVPMIHLSQVDPAELADQVNTDVTGFFNIVQAALPSLREDGGAVVAVTSAGTRRYPVRDGLSTVPKASVEAIVYGFAAEEGRYNIRFNCVGPGMLTDGMAERLIAAGDLDERALDAARGNIALRRFGQAHDVADAAAFLVSDRAKYISGQKLDVDG